MDSLLKSLMAILVASFLLLAGAYGAAASQIGVIMTGDTQYYNELHKAFLDSMGDKGHEIVVQKPMPDSMSWTNAARKLATIGSAVIVSYGAPATLTTMKVTSEIPIVFAGVYEPDAMGLTGKNATGISSTVPVEMLLKKMNEISKLSKVAVVLSKAEKDSILQTKMIKNSESSFGFKASLITVSGKINKDEIQGASAILLTSCSAAMINVKDIVAVARKDKIPTASLMGGGENDGVVLTVSANPEEQGKELADMVQKVIGGAKPSDLPVKKPTKVDVIVNLKEAKANGINVPQGVISSATKVIE